MLCACVIPIAVLEAPTSPSLKMKSRAKKDPETFIRKKWLKDRRITRHESDWSLTPAKKF
jgi:hypothetical protein